MPGPFYLTILTLLPLAGALAVAAAGPRRGASRAVALVTALVELGLTLWCLGLGSGASTGPAGWLLWEDWPWVPALGLNWTLGLDGISLVLLLLTAFLQILCVLVSWHRPLERPQLYYGALLVLQGGVNGVFLAQDLFLFYLFWELQIIPLFFLVGIWGHENRVHASFKLILFTMAGSVLLLVGFLGLYALHGAATGTYTFSLPALLAHPPGETAQLWLMAALLVGFAVKVPVVPLHTWLPEAHTQAPVAGSVMLAGVLLKTGAYAILRLALPLLPLAASRAAPLLLFLALTGLFYAAWVARAQEDLKRLVAYSSISHLALVILGLAAWNLVSLSGAVLQMINHGLSTSALFLLAGMLEERLHSRRLADMGGLWTSMPVFAAFFLFFAMASLGLPGLNNFPGELLVLVGTFQNHPAAAVLGFTGLLWGVVYVLRMIQATIFGPAKPEAAVWDLSGREVLILGSLALAVLFMGLAPGVVLDLVQPPLAALATAGGPSLAAAF
ncbi:MAG: NADH-quinone oxidoreductase subunit M [Deltaproteobacteria bacterium]|nr:NADH-quinone oxidoreductase subunit M [Deltaproteobacteria bacterium]